MFGFHKSVKRVLKAAGKLGVNAGGGRRRKGVLTYV